MGLFSKLFGSKNKGKKANKEEKAVPAAEEKVVEEPVKEVAPVEEKAEEPVVKETAPEAEEKKPAAKKPAVKKAPAKKEETPVKEISPEEKAAKEAEEAEAEALEKEAETVEVKSVAAGRFEIKKSKDGRFVFNLYAANRVIVATSQVYSSSTAAMNGIKSIIANAERSPIEDQTLKNFQPIGYPKWEIFTDKSGQYRFRLNAPNGNCIVHSQGYTTKANCKNGIQSIIRNTKDASVDKAYLKKGEE